MEDSTDDIAISVRNLTKTYRLCDHHGNRVKQALVNEADKATFVA